jgi:hypothetical protein
VVPRILRDLEEYNCVAGGNIDMEMDKHVTDITYMVH